MADDLSRKFVVVGQQSMDAARGSLVSGYRVALNQCMMQHLTGGYSKSVERIGIVIRIDSSEYSFGPGGPSRYRFLAKQKSVTIDVGVPATKWLEEDHELIRREYFETVDEAICAVLTRLEADAVSFDTEQFEDDWKRCQECYLSSTETKPETGFRLPGGRMVKPPHRG